MKHIILVEDDLRLANLVKDFLQQNSFNVTLLNSGLDAVETIIVKQPDLLLLDINLPEKDGFTICREIKDTFTNPILFLTARDSSIDHVMGLEIGADDYIIKPVDPHVLLARINVLLRKTQNKEPVKRSHEINIGGLTVNKHARTVYLFEEEVAVTTHEFELLWLLAKFTGEPQSRELIHQSMIGREYDGLDRTVDVRISRLRRKLADDPNKPFRIVTVWGKGYMLCPDAWGDK